MKFYILIFLFIMSSRAYSQSLEVHEVFDSFGDQERPYVTAGKGTGATKNRMYTGTSSPIDVYIAVEVSGSGEDETQYVNVEEPSNIPDMNDLATAEIRVSLIYTVPSSNYQFLAAVKDQDDSDQWKVLENSPMSIPSSTSSSSYVYVLNLDTLNSISNADITNTEEKNYEIDVAIMLYDTDDVIKVQGDTITPSSYNPVYYTILLSDKSPDNTRLILTELKKGDERLTAVFENGENVEWMNADLKYKVLALSWGDLADHTDDTFGTGGFTVLDDIDAIYEGKLDIKGLSNRDASGHNNYNISVVLMNKYKFVSASSNSKIQTPEKIDVFLQAQACFIVSAGFGERHYVIDYFRNFRDNVLVKFSLGQKFVDLYYTYSPRYALKLYENDRLRKVVRIISYGIYYLMNFYYIVVLGILGLILFNLRRKRLSRIAA